MPVRFLGRYAFAAALNAAALVSALAGDLSVPPVFTPESSWRPARFSWTGCHVGGHFGGGWVDDHVAGLFTAPPAPSSPPLTVITKSGDLIVTNIQDGPVLSPIALNTSPTNVGASGLLAGGQAGCDFQFAPNWVIGIDGDASGANISGASNQTRSVGFTGFPVPAVTTVSSAGNLSAKINFISTVTGRLGYTFGYMGKGLFYGKAGAAFTNDTYSLVGQTSTKSCNTWLITLPDDPVGSCKVFNPAVPTPFNFGLSQMSVGWTIGAGIEWAVVNNWSVKLEYDYLDFPSRNLTFANPVPNINVNQRISEVKFGINYLFGWQ